MKKIQTLLPAKIQKLVCIIVSLPTDWKGTAAYTRAGFNNSNTIRNFTLALSSNCTLVIQNFAMPLVNCKHIQASILRSLLFSDVTKSWLVTDVSGQPTAPTFKGQAVQVFLNQQGGPKHWYLTTNKFCLTSQNGEDLI